VARRKNRGFASARSRKWFFANYGQSTKSSLHHSDIVDEPRYNTFSYAGSKFSGAPHSPKKILKKESQKVSTLQQEYQKTNHELLKTHHNSSSSLKEKIKHLNPEQIAGAIALTTSVMTGNPLPSVLYQGYKAYKYSKKIGEKFSETSLLEELLQITKKNVNSITQKIFEEKINQVSTKITKTSQDAGLFRFLSDNSSYSESAIQTLFKSTLDNGLKDGVGSATNFAVEALF